MHCSSTVGGSTMAWDFIQENRYTHRLFFLTDFRSNESPKDQVKKSKFRRRNTLGICREGCMGCIENCYRFTVRFWCLWTTTSAGLLAWHSWVLGPAGTHFAVSWRPQSETEMAQWVSWVTSAKGQSVFLENLNRKNPQWPREGVSCSVVGFSKLGSIKIRWLIKIRLFRI